MVKFVAALVLLGYFAQNTISQEIIPWENRYLDVSAAVELGLSSGTIVFPDEGSLYGSNTRLRYTIHGGEVSLQFSQFAFEHSYDGVSITFQRENNVAEEYLFSERGGHGKGRKKRSAKQLVNSERVRSSGAECDGGSSFSECYGSDYENAESWVGSGSGNITIEIFTDVSDNYPGFELVWSIPEDETTTAEPTTAEPLTAEATTPEATTGQASTADVITTEASDLCELVDCHSGQCEVVFPDYYYTHSIHSVVLQEWHIQRTGPRQHLVILRHCRQPLLAIFLTFL